MTAKKIPTFRADPNHEVKVCLAVVRRISEETGIHLEIKRKPDSENSGKKAVDYVAEGGSLHVALEHTIIECFPGQRGSDDLFKRIFCELERNDLCGGLEWPGDYRLILCSREELLKNARKNACGAIRAALLAFVKREAKALSIQAEKTNGTASLTARPEGVPFEVELFCAPYETFRLRASSRIPADLQQQLRSRIEKALQDKCFKLADARRQRSALVLELADIALGNENDISRALNSAVAEHQEIPMPDDIYLVRTELRKWEVWTLKRGEAWNPAEQPYFVEHHELDAIAEATMQAMY